MSLYYVQKLLYKLNRDPTLKQRFDSDQDAVLDEYSLSEEEINALKRPDIGLLYVLGAVVGGPGSVEGPNPWSRPPR